MNEFEIRYDMETGGVKSLSNKNDSSKMNWAKGENVWGTVKDGTLISCVENDNGITAVYKTKNNQITVHRYTAGNIYREKYILKNILNTDILTNRGAIGIYTTFNDNYETAEISMTSRCHTHIWCGRNTSYVNAVKMGMCDFGLGLVLINGSLDTYSRLYKITGESYLIDECKKHLEVLQLFNGTQPSFFLNDIAIRHWDGFWFGKRRLYGDTFPHYWSILSSIAFLHYSEISGNNEYKRRAFVGARNNLCLFNADGSASCAHIYPLTVNGIRGEYFDEFANDQDFALYYFINFFEKLKQEKE